MISEIYSQIVFDDIVKQRYLDRGASPSADQSAAIMGQVAGKRLGASGSSLTYTPGSEGESSAEAIQRSLTTFSEEVRSVFVGSALIKDRTKRLFDRAENQLALINKQTVDAALEACALAQGRQQKFNYAFWDTFIDLTKIDQLLTSLEFDPRGQTARLKTRPNERRLNLAALEDKDFDVIVIKGDIAGQTVAPGSRLFYAVDDSDSYWLQRAHCLTDGDKGLALQIDLGEETVLSRVSFSPFGANTDSGLQVRVLGSLNSINWRELMPMSQQTSTRVTVDCAAIRARYLRIEMIKTVPSFRTQEVAGFVYEFGMNDLRVFESMVYPTGQLVSKDIQFTDVLGNVQRINRLKFNFYDERPAGTEIIYYITTDPDSAEGLIQVTPDVPIELTTVLEKREDQGKIRARHDQDHAIIGLPLEDGYVVETIRLFRNTYQFGVLIDGIQSGWRFKDSYFSCIIELILEKEINLGVSFAYIDGRKVNGIQTLAPGFHTFRTHETNWRPAISEADDPLFPYNHKLIVEGLKGSTVYDGVGFMAAQELNLISAFDLVENIPSTNGDYFGIYGQYPMVKIPPPPVFLTSAEGWRSEQYAIRYKYVSDSLAPVTSVRLVARMSTTNTRLTPVLKGYIALAGF